MNPMERFKMKLWTMTEIQSSHLFFISHHIVITYIDHPNIDSTFNIQVSGIYFLLKWSLMGVYWSFGGDNLK